MPKSPQQIEDEKWIEDFNLDVEEYIRSLKWFSDTPDIYKTIVAGNIRGFAAHIKDRLGNLPKEVASTAVLEFIEGLENRMKEKQILFNWIPQDKYGYKMVKAKDLDILSLLNKAKDRLQDNK